MRFKKVQHGDERIIRRFALLPVEVGNEYRWLEFIYYRQVYLPKDQKNGFMYEGGYCWKTTNLITNPESLRRIS